MVVEPGDPIYTDATGEAAVCREACNCCGQRRPALRAKIWPVADIVEHLL
jgi:hypothetical protein